MSNTENQSIENTVIEVKQVSPIESEDEGFSENSQPMSLTIKGPTGSVRGIRHCVRQNIQNFHEIISNSKIDRMRNFEKEETAKVVLYSTTLGVIRKTFENCRKIRGILYQHMILFEERDIYLNSEFRFELRERCSQYELPSLFVNGKFFANCELAEKLNENGKLSQLLISFKLNPLDCGEYFQICNCCGNAKFIPCDQCNGSKKSLIRHFNCDSITLRCSHCNQTGLVRCPKCFSPRSPSRFLFLSSSSSSSSSASSTYSISSYSSSSSSP